MLLYHAVPCCTNTRISGSRSWDFEFDCFYLFNCHTSDIIPLGSWHRTKEPQLRHIRPQCPVLSRSSAPSEYGWEIPVFFVSEADFCQYALYQTLACLSACFCQFIHIESLSPKHSPYIAPYIAPCIARIDVTDVDIQFHSKNLHPDPTFKDYPCPIFFKSFNVHVHVHNR